MKSAADTPSFSKFFVYVDSCRRHVLENLLSGVISMCVVQVIWLFVFAGCLSSHGQIQVRISVSL